MECQKKLFSLEEGVHYLNCAYKAPLLKASEEACIRALRRERNPAQMSVDDFFSDSQKVREYFAEIIHADAPNIAIIPSVSYGFSTALNNIAGKHGGKAITIQDEFPSGYFALQRWCRENNNELIVVHTPKGKTPVGRQWNADLLKQIDEKTSVVLLSSVHWMNGLRFDLEAIGKKCREVGAKLLVDGTQSVGALKMDVQAFHIDALVCATYKWLFGPYSIALAYLNETFENGKPLEESWMNRINAREFSALSQYEERYGPHAARYNVGESSNFILMPLLRESLRQVLAWGPENIQAYCRQLISPLRHFLSEMKLDMEEEEYFSNHLFALPLPPGTELQRLRQLLKENKISISLRGAHLRTSVNVFNDEADIQKLIEVLTRLIQ